MFIYNSLKRAKKALNSEIYKTIDLRYSLVDNACTGCGQTRQISKFIESSKGQA